MQIVSHLCGNKLNIMVHLRLVPTTHVAFCTLRCRDQSVSKPFYLMMDFYVFSYSIYVMKQNIDFIDNAIFQANKKILTDANLIANDLNFSTNKDWFIVGGFVRDAVLNELSGRVYKSKDVDIILSWKAYLENNQNIISRQENSFGGLKLCTKNFHEIDIFNQVVVNPDYFIVSGFDFNCNAIYFSCSEQNIYASYHFYNFFLNQKIDIMNLHYTKCGMESIYPVYSTVSRALKFQVVFREKYNMNIELSDNVWYMLACMDKKAEFDMFQYMRQKVKDENIIAQMIKNYYVLKRQ